MDEGTIKLLSCEWLLESAAKDMQEAKSLGLDGKLPKLMRRQELEKWETEKEGRQAFLPQKHAAAIFHEGKRKVLVLSYGWLSSFDPDPKGQRLKQIIKFLQGQEAGSLKGCGFFMDSVCLPQCPRNKEEEAQFQKGLPHMMNLYASVTGTAVVQMPAVEEFGRPWDNGQVVVLNHTAGIRESLKTVFGAQSADKALIGPSKPEFDTTLLQFETQAQAAEKTSLFMGGRSEAGKAVKSHYFKRPSDAVTAYEKMMASLKEANGGNDVEVGAAFDAYNGRPYEQRGWCCLEERLALLVETQLGELKKDGFSRPNQTKTTEPLRPKLAKVDNEGKAESRLYNPEGTTTSNDVAEELLKQMENAEGPGPKFTNPADAEPVKKALNDFLLKLAHGKKQLIEHEELSREGTCNLLRRKHVVAPAQE